MRDHLDHQLRREHKAGVQVHVYRIQTVRRWFCRGNRRSSYDIYRSEETGLATMVD